MIENLREDQFYELLPDCVVTADERGLIRAVIGGVQDRFDDLRALSSKLSFFFAVGSLPETGLNAVLVDVNSNGITVTRSLEIHDDTPAETNTIGLTAWVSAQLGLDPSQFSNIRYGLDRLRQVDANLLGYLASTIGAVLYASPLAADETTAQQQLVSTYFPRLKIKGTVRSFEVLGRILGFDDVKMTPLWSRVSPRRPEDVGNPVNNPDFAQKPDYQPQQYLGVDYNPLATRDGPFYTWQSAVSNILADTQYYETIVNGFSPFISVATVTTQGGTVTHPSTGSYALAGGDAYTRARVTPPGSGVQFIALVQGEAYNGLMVSVTSGTGSLATLSVLDQLSAIKYRSAFYDLALAADMDRVEDIFGANAVRRNVDLAAGTNTPDGVALSPFRPWTAGSVATPLLVQDFLTATQVSNGTTVITARHQAQATDRELNVSQLVSAGVTVGQAFEEVRPATRFPRRSRTGFLLEDKVPYAFYGTRALLFVSGGSSVYAGTDAFRPLPQFEVDIQVINSNGTFDAVASSDPADPALWHYQATPPGVVFTGSYQFTAGSYYWNIAPGTSGQQVWAYYTITTTEVVRPEPSFAVKSAGIYGQSDRPEDEWAGTRTDFEWADEYPWRRDVVNEGELVEVDAYLPSSPDIAVQPVDAECVFQDQTSAEYSVRTVRSSATPHQRYTTQVRSVKPYVPGMLPVAYSGVFKNLATLTAQEASDLNTLTDAETLFQAGFTLYHAGLAQGVLVADLPKFFGPQHRDSLVGWLPFDEHPEGALSVTDHSPVNGNHFISGIGPNNRVWDDSHGWYLSVPAQGIISSTDVRNWGTEQTASFWFLPVASSGTQTVLVSGGLSFDYNGPASTVSAYALANAVRVRVATSGSFSGWRFFYLRRSAAQAVFGNGTLGAPVVETALNSIFDADADGNQVVIQAGTSGFGLHDLRLWSKQKTQAEMDLVHYHNPTPTAVNYPIGFVQSASDGDRYGLRVLANGWVTTDIMPAWVRRPAMAWVRRYDDMGRYAGESRFKETGLGGGAALPALYQLGGQFQCITATGTAVVATGTGQVPGVSDLWLADTSKGTYAAVFSGTGTTTFLSTSASPWPQDIIQTNPVRDYVWVNGQDGYVYEVTADGTLSATQLKVQRVFRDRVDSEILVNPIYSALLSTGTYWSVGLTSTISGTLNGTLATLTVST